MRHLGLMTTLLLACGSDPAGPPPPAPPPSLAVAPATAQLTSGGLPVTFSATLTGTTGAIHWTLDGPGMLSSESGPTIIYTPPASLDDDTQATLSAGAGAVSARATISLTRAPGILVAGRVVDFRGTPVPDVAIAIGTQTTETDASGNFAIGNVSTPYTLAAFSVVRHTGLVYQGLTRADPTILWRQAVSTPDRAATVQGALSGGGPVLTDDVHTLVHWSSPEAESEISALSSSYSMAVGWAGPPRTTGAVHVLQLSGTRGGIPTGYPGYGVRSGITLQDRAAPVSVDVAMTRPQQSVVQGSVALPLGHDLLIRFLALHFNAGGFLVLGFDAGPDLDFNFPVPGGIDATAAIFVESQGPGGLVSVRDVGIPLGATDVSLEIPPPAASIAPLDEAVDVDGQTEFSWGALPGSVYTFAVTTTPPAPSLFVITRDTRAAIPQLPGLSLPSGTRYAWQVIALGPFASVDDAAGPVPLTSPTPRAFQSSGDHRLFDAR